MYCEITHCDAVTTVTLRGSITSENAREVETAVAGEPKDTGGIIVDARELSYTSSAGLRVILGMKKRCKGMNFQIINVNPEVKNVFDVTGFTEIMEISMAPRQIRIEGCEKIGAGACGECYRIDDETIVKLYYPKTTSTIILDTTTRVASHSARLTSIFQTMASTFLKRAFGLWDTVGALRRPILPPFFWDRKTV